MPARWAWLWFKSTKKLRGNCPQVPALRTGRVFFFLPQRSFLRLTRLAQTLWIEALP